MPLTKEEVQSWDRPKVDKALNEIRDNVASLREKNGGTIAGLAGDEADKVRESMAHMNILGERRDEIMELEKADGQFHRLSEFLTEPDPERGHPGHGSEKGNGAAAAARTKGPRDAGGLFVESEAWKAFTERGEKNRPITVPVDSVFGRAYQGIGEIPSDLRLQAALFDSTSFPSRPDVLTPPIEALFQANNIGPLMPQGTTDSDTIRYPVETVTATGAAETAEGSTKPEAQLSFADTDEPLRTIPVLLPITDKALKNQPFLRAYINARLRLFVQMREDSQLLVGNGTAPNLKGILNRSGINTATSYSIGGANPDQALIDAVFHAAMRVRDAFVEPDGAVMKPSTWEIAVLAKDGNRNYLLGGPGAYAQGDPTPRLWGLKVVLNANMPAQSATNKDVLVGAFAASAMVVRRGGIELAVSDSHSTFFAENKVMLRAEEEVALCVFRPAGFATVTSAA